MDMDSSMSGGPGLTDVGLDMSNYTVASDFLAALLDDTTLQQSDYAIARAFWYGLVIVIVLAGIVNWSQWGLLKLRSVTPAIVSIMGRLLTPCLDCVQPQQTVHGRQVLLIRLPPSWLVARLWFEKCLTIRLPPQTPGCGYQQLDQSW